MFDKVTNFSNFGNSFQEKLAHIMLLDREFTDQMLEVLKVEFFDLEHLKLFVYMILQYKEKYEFHPSIESMETLVRLETNESKDVVHIALKEFFNKIKNAKIEPNDEKFIKEKSLDFCRKQKMKEAMIKSHKMLSTGSFDEISKIINEALRLGSDRDFGYRYLEDFELRFNKQDREIISTGWDQFDKITEGGFGKGELIVIIGGSGAGKSQVMVYLSTQALKQGKTVVYYTLELSDSVIAGRHDCCLTNIPLSDRFLHKPEILNAVKEVPGKLIIKEYPTRRASVISLENHIKRLHNHDIYPDFVVVDYADLLKADGYDKETRLALGQIYEDLRGLAKQYNFVCLTGSQCNRGAYNQSVITMDGISESFNKCFVSDFIFSLGRTVEDKTTDSGRFFVAKNRNGIDGLIFPIYMNTSTVQIAVFEPTEETIEDIKNRQTINETKSTLSELQKRLGSYFGEKK